MSRAFTQDEVCDQFLAALDQRVRYWSSDVVDDQDVEERMRGLVHSILALIDGITDDLPPITLYAEPHHEHRAEREVEDQNWYDPDVAINADPDIMLHDAWGQYTRRR